jgi:hypothetical protein
MDMEMEAGVATTLLRQFDLLLVNILSALTNIAPNFAKLNFSKFLVEGYAIDFDHIAIALSTAFALCIGFSIFGYFCLKTREIAK